MKRRMRIHYNRPPTLFWLSKIFSVRQVKKHKDRKIFTQLWHSIWLDEEYAKEGEPIIEKYEKYDPFSVDFLAKFLGLFPVGTLRIIENNNEIGLPVLNDFEVERPWGNGIVMEVTLLTIIPQFRGLFNLSSLSLMKTMYQYCRPRSKGIVIAADRRLFILLRRRFSFPFVQIGPEKMYEGSTTYPAYLGWEEAERVLAQEKPALLWFFTSS